MKKDFSNTPVSEIARMAYALACENAEQEVNTVNDHGDRDPRYEREERTQEWECMIMTDAICGMKLFIDANFTCPTPSEISIKSVATTSASNIEVQLQSKTIFSMLTGTRFITSCKR